MPALTVNFLHCLLIPPGQHKEILFKDVR
jgi:hypothetical protein